MWADLARPCRALVAAAVALSATALAAVQVPAARAEGPPPAPAASSIAALRADVLRTGDRIAAATVAWERGQQRLGQLLQQKVGTERTVEQLQADAQTARRRISSLASSLYRNPVSPAITAVLDGNVRSVTDLYYVQRTREQTSNDQRRDIARLVTEAADTTALLSRQDRAASDAIRLQSQLDAELSRLQADALNSQQRLLAAVAELRRQQAAATAAALARSFGVADGPSCSAPVPVDAINGFLPPSSLCALASAPGHRLIGPAARAFDAMSEAFAASQGRPLCVTDSYRDYPGQVDVFRRKPNLAATPGRSQHGWGRALDLCGGVQVFGSPAFLWLKTNAASFGFAHPDWAEPDGSKPEPWHWEYTP